MKLARYVGGGRIEILDEAAPECPDGGILIQTEASGLCSGELMDWYMERKVPHVLGHEVSGTVLESHDPRFPVGMRAVPHHHAPCMECEFCRTGRYVHCPQWKSTKLFPGGMAERFAVSARNLTDTHRAEDLRPQDAALMEPLGCVMKSIRISGVTEGRRTAVIGLGTMGLMHMLALRDLAPIGIDISPSRREWGGKLGFQVRDTDIDERFDKVFVCPGSQSALDLGFRIAAPGATVVLFAPMPPGEQVRVPWDRLYFEEISLVPSYSCGPLDTAQALEKLRRGEVKAEQVVSDFIGINELPRAYEAMKKGEILKAMVIFE